MNQDSVAVPTRLIRFSPAMGWALIRPARFARPARSPLLVWNMPSKITSTTVCGADVANANAVASASVAGSPSRLSKTLKIE